MVMETRPLVYAGGCSDNNGRRSLPGCPLGPVLCRAYSQNRDRAYVTKRAAAAAGVHRR
jgi:hypothetical protein